MQFPVITYGMALYINDSYVYRHTNIEKIYVYASERAERASLENFLAFLHSKTAISFNILLVLQILCRYKWHACRLTCSDKFRNVPTKLWKSIIGGGGGIDPLPPPPPPATLMAGNAKEADIWFGRESARARSARQI